MDETVKAELKRLWDESTHQNKRIEKLESEVDEMKKMSVAVERLAVQMECLTKGIAKLDTDVEEIKNRPAHAWNTVTLTAVTAVVSFIVGNILSQLM